MDLGLTGKRAFVTGASSGIGTEIALELAREGCAIAVHGRDKVRTEEAAHQVEALGAKAVAVFGDLTDAADCERLANDTLVGLGSVDIVVNNAGVAARKDNPTWSELTFQEYIDAYELNFMSALRMSKHFLPCFKANHWGRIINISSYAAVMAGVLSEYACAKFALNKLTADMSKEVGKYGATANGIMPGIIMTPAIIEYLHIIAGQLGWEGGLDDFEQRHLTDLTPQSVQRMGRPADIAKLTAFLASDAAGYITGMTIRVNGGAGSDV